MVVVAAARIAAGTAQQLCMGAKTPSFSNSLAHCARGSKSHPFREAWCGSIAVCAMRLAKYLCAERFATAGGDLGACGSRKVFWQECLGARKYLLLGQLSFLLAAVEDHTFSSHGLGRSRHHRVNRALIFRIFLVLSLGRGGGRCRLLLHP